MFEPYSEEFTIKTRDGPQKVKLLPLRGRHYNKFLTAVKKVMPKEGSEDDLSLTELDADGLALVHELVLESMKLSYPKADADNLDMFVTQNLFQFLEPLIKVNMPSTDEHTQS